MSYRGFHSGEDYEEWKRDCWDMDAWEEREAEHHALARGDPWPPEDIGDRSWLDDAYREPPRHPDGRPMRINEV